MELRFYPTLYSNLGNENSDAGHVKCLPGPQVPNSWFRIITLKDTGRLMRPTFA